MLSGFRVHRSCVHTSTNRAVAIGHSAKDKGKRKLGARDLVVPTVCFGANAAAPIAGVVVVVRVLLDRHVQVLRTL